MERDAKQGYATIVGGDFNNDNTDQSKMTMTLQPSGYVNITSPTGENTPATFKHSKRTLDHIWVSSALAPLITRYGYLPFDF